jgi:hypothetical protein
MNYADMEKEISSRTGLPLPAVQLVLSSMRDIITESLMRQQDVVFRGLFRITSSAREITSFKTPVGAEEPTREKAYRLVLGIHPFRPLRQELNKWTSSLSSSMKST